VASAAAAGRRVKAVGSGHSFTDIACTSGLQLDMRGLDRIVCHDNGSRTVTVEAGITIASLSAKLARLGLALPNLGDVAYQTISGAISTGTHGTGIRFGGLATQVVGLQIVSGDGSVVSCAPESEPDLLAAARVGLGALGIVATVTLQCVPAFRLRAVEQPMRADDMIASLDELVEGNEHFEAYLVPHTPWALTKQNNRTDAPVTPRPGLRRLRDRILLENVAFGAACTLGRWRPELVPRLARAVPSSGRTEFVDRSDRVFTTPRWVRFCEMEYAVPRERAVEVIQSVRELLDKRGLYVSFPVELRFSAADDIPLSMSSGRQSCYVAVHMFKGVPYEQYFRAVEAVMRDAGGRPHWGKLHYQTSSSLRTLYPGWERFQSARRRLDPAGVFANDYTDRVIGPIPG
jgi:FAD-linked oxidoreductase